MSVLLDPATHDPYINEKGQLVYIQDEVQSALQHLRVWLHTGKGTELMDSNYGFDIRGVLHGGWERDFGYTQLIGVQLQKACNELADFISSITIEKIVHEDRVLSVYLLVKTVGGQSGQLTVTLE
jgi:hypothetical protein